MSALREAAQQALEAICGAKRCEINSISSRHEMVRLMDEAITALRAALAEPEQEPVAWAGCGECDCSFPCHKGEARCLRLPPHEPPEFIDLDLKEMDEIIDGNMKITDSRLRDAVYAVVIDTVTTLMKKNT